MKKAKHLFRRRSLFMKTWFISLAGIFLTTGLLFVVIGYFADTFIYDTQEANFEKTSSEIVELIKAGQLAALTKYVAQGYTIQIDENTLRNVDPQPQLGEAPELGDEGEFPAEEPSVTTNSRLLVDPKKNFRKDQHLVIAGQETTVIIYYPIALTQNEIVDVIWTVAPYFLMTTLLVSSIIGLGYASYFSRKIKQMNQVVGEMARETYPVHLVSKEGDELQELNNHLHEMYAKLRQTMTALEEENTLVKKLEDSRRLFMSGIAHELKTPIMNMDLSLKGVYLEETDHHKRQNLRKQLDYLTGMNRLVSELLELSRVDEGTLSERATIAPVLAEITEVYSEMIEDKQQQIQLTVKGEASMVIPVTKLKKLFSNLVGNAIKYAPEKSVIAITLSQEAIAIENPMRPLNHHLSVEDLHKPFVTTDEAADYPSHGLGLYLIQSTLSFYDYQANCEIKDGRFIYTIFLEPS